MRRAVVLLFVLGCRPEPRPVVPVAQPYPPQPGTAPAVVAPTATMTPAPEIVAPPPGPAAGGPPWQVGHATWYGAALAGHRTASGERFDPSQMTAAHKTLKLGTWVEVRRTDTGQRVRVRINDRGPFGPPSWIIDVSRGAADVLQMVRAGVVPVEIRIVAGP